MSRIIDFEQPLSADDEIYLSTRPWLVAQAERQGFELVYAGDEILDPESPESPESPEEEEAETVDYNTLSIKDLQAAIASRNEGRDDADKIVADSKGKADLVAALELDDETEEEEEEEDDE